MAEDYVPITRDLLALMRKAAGAAMQTERGFINPYQMLLALLDDPTLAPALESHIDRANVQAAVDAVSGPPGVRELPEQNLPEGEEPPFQRYDTLAFRGEDGTGTAWLDADAFKLFMEGAKRTEGTAYAPRHLALGVIAISRGDGGMLSSVGANVQEVTKAIFEL